MSLDDLLNRFDMKKHGGSSINEENIAIFKDISALLMNYTAFKNNGSYLDPVPPLAKICSEKFTRSGRLCSAICGTISLLSAYAGEDESLNTVIETVLKATKGLRIDKFAYDPENDDECNSKNGGSGGYSSSGNACRALIICLGALGFFSIVTDEPLEILKEIVFNKDPRACIASNSEAFAAAINSWVFLLTLNPTKYLDSINECLDFLYDLLNVKQLDVLLAVTRALAYIDEILIDNEMDSIKEDVAALIDEFAVNIPAQKTKKGKAAESDFISVRNYFETGKIPNCSFKIQEDSVTTTTWVELIRLDFFHLVLQGGFENHLKNNELFEQIFNITKSIRGRGRFAKAEFILHKNQADKIRKTERIRSCDYKYN